jgi:excisionase family DNA binding protein
MLHELRIGGGMVERRMMTIDELAQYLNISKYKIYRGINSKTEDSFPVKPLRIGRKILFDKKAVDRYIESN